MKSHWFKI